MTALIESGRLVSFTYPRATGRPMTQTSFSTLQALSDAELANLEQLGFTRMTEIQQQTLPKALAGEDIIAQAKTGSGKTASFAIPLLHKLNQRFFAAQALVLCPTRELASQVADDIRKLARFQANIKVVVLSGGVPIGPQIASLEHGAHVVVGTPGRIKDHLRKNTLDLSHIETLVLDEADRMLDMGFRDDIHEIAAQTARKRQTLLFSATYPPNIEELSRSLQHKPVRISVASTHQASSIQQRVIMCPRNQKPEVLIKAIQHFNVQQGIIFCNTRPDVEAVAQWLRNHGYTALALHGDLEQSDREEIYVRFKNGSSHFLVATDVAARGLDVDDLPAVVNYDLPREREVYTHRIGRTGRAGSTGLAISLAYEKDSFKISAINALQEQDMQEYGVEKLCRKADNVEKPKMVTLCFAAGRKEKLRPGDILGALTAEGGVPGAGIGKIDVLDQVAYVAVERQHARQALEHLRTRKIKNKSIKVRRI